MNLISLIIGVVAGILFSFAFPEPAIAVNDAISPFVISGLIFIKDVLIDVIRTAIGGVIA